MKDACTYQHCLCSNTEGAEAVLHSLLYVGTTQDIRQRRLRRRRANTLTGAAAGDAGEGADGRRRTEAEEMMLGLRAALF